MAKKRNQKVNDHAKRGQIRENRQGKDFGGFKGYVEDIWGNRSLAKIQRRTRKTTTKKKQTKPKQNLEKLSFVASLVVL